MTRKLTRTHAALLLALSALAAALSPATSADSRHTTAAADTRTPAATLTAKTNTAATAARLEKSLTRLPARFEANAGQADARVRFVSRGAGHTLLLAADGATLALRTAGGREEGAPRDDARRALGENARARSVRAPSFQLLGMKFVGANPRAEVAGEGLLEGRVNYLVGRDASKWRTGVQTFASVRYRELYPGVDLVYHGGVGDRLEYDFHLAPGADYRDVRLRFDGVERLSLGAGGELLLHTKAGTIVQSAPVVYQQLGGGRRAVAGRYALRGRREVSFHLGDYDRSAPLVIDPVLVYSTYFYNAYRMAVDTAGSVYVIGSSDTFAGEFPTTPGAFQTTRRGSSDAYVAKLNPEGTELSYLTYLGGNDGPHLSGELGQDIAVDAAGNAYVTGLTHSNDFPVVNAFQPASGGGGSEGFVAKLNPSGSSLVYSSYLGGSDTEWCKSVALDAAGSAYVYGDTFSPNFPTRNPLQPSLRGGIDFFLTKVAPDGKTLEYSTYLGGSGGEAGYLGDLAVDAAGAAYVAGTTTSEDYPVTPGAFQTSQKTPHNIGFTDAVVTKVAPGGASLVYSTYLGGLGIDFAFGIAVDAAGQAHVAGTTLSTDFPTQNALYPSSRDPYGDGFLSKLNAAGTALVYSTYLSGTPKHLCGPTRLNGDLIACGGEAASGVATDATGNAYVTGNSISENFPAPVDALQPKLKGPMDAYVIKLNPAGQALYSTYLGGGGFDDGADVKADAAGAVYLLGYTTSDDFPTVRPFRDGFARDQNPLLNNFVARLSDADAPAGTSRVRFDAAVYAVGEGGGSVRVGVTRAGDLSQAVEVDYSTGGGEADERSDYTTARGTLRFAPGETAKSFSVSVTDDNTVEGDESLGLTLHDLRGAAVLDAPASASLTIADDDEHPSPSNPIDGSEFFVRQHYLDFLGREPDPDGLAFWTNEIESCGADAACREVKRVNVSAAFFLSIEFQETGFLVARLHRLAFGSQVPYRTFVRDAREVGEGVVVGQGAWRETLDANRRAYAEEFVARTAFREEFPESLTARQYVEHLNEKTSGALSASESDALVAGLEAGTETRATALLKVADDADFRASEFAPAFVLMQYLGYLRRNPGDWPDNGEGFRFWLAKLNSFGGDFQRAEMVKAFISSEEYRRRFHEPATEAALGSPFRLRLGETAIIQPDRLRVTLRDVGPDSRCPRDVQCVHAGSVSVLIHVFKASGETVPIILSIPGGVPRPHPSNPPVSALGYRFRLLQLDPEPPYGTQPAPYEALLLVEPN